MTELAIRCEDLSKQYRIGERVRYRALRDTITETISAPFRLFGSALKGRSASRPGGYETFWALKDISFEIKRGEIVGIIGRNGAGKSTLLKILSRITAPTKGEVDVQGRVGSLLEVGTGFHPELTGRENIFLNGAILGMSKAHIIRKFDEIVAFAEVEKFLDTPVKHYSSGMYVRLAFAVAAHLEPDVMVIDEVLAVGDAAFQNKCLGKMQDVAKEGRTILFVSHDMTAIQALCSRAIRLRLGEIVGSGPTSEQIEQYLNEGKALSGVRAGQPVQLSKNIQLQKFQFDPDPVVSGKPLSFSMELWAPEATRINDLAIIIYTALGRRAAILDLRKPDLSFNLDGTSKLRIDGAVSSFPMVEGDYYLGLSINSSEVVKDFDDLSNITVSSKAAFGDIAPIPAQYRGIVELDFEASRRVP